MELKLQGFCSIDPERIADFDPRQDQGVYVLLFKTEGKFRVGSLGSVRLSGVYAYVGSAQKNLKARLERHLRKNKRIHWHIDYVLSSSRTKILKIYVKENASKKEECKTANLLGNKLKLEPIPKFGSSDCRCFTHLFRLR